MAHWRAVGAALLLVSAIGVAPRAGAADAPAVAANPALETRMMAIAVELRCLVCQNQTIADSQAGLAVDLRQQIREMLAKGMDSTLIAELTGLTLAQIAGLSEAY